MKRISSSSFAGTGGFDGGGGACLGIAGLSAEARSGAGGGGGGAGAG